MRTYKTPHGEYPSVTEILSMKDKSGALMGWVAKMGAEAVTEYWEATKKPELEQVIALIKGAYRSKQRKALDIGSKVHNAIEVFTKAPSVAIGMKLVTADHDYPIYEKPFGAFLKWHDEVGFKLIEGEHQVWSVNHCFAGTLDCIAMINGKKTLGDYKSSTAIRDEYLWQIGAYNVAYEEMSGVSLENFGCLRLDKLTGLPEWVEWSKNDVMGGFHKFECLLKLWWLENGRKLCKK